MSPKKDCLGSTFVLVIEKETPECHLLHWVIDIKKEDFVR